MTDENRQSIPYIGPRPFERQEHDLFFGRDREVSELLSLITSHRTVLLYAQSGAGKTSLINASLIPHLEEEMFTVLPLARVKGVLPENIKSKEISNIYVFNTLLSWVDNDFELTRLSEMTIKDFLRDFKNSREGGELPVPHVIIFDQFEELFSSYQERWKDRNEFFKQVAEALEHDHLLRVVFVIREDYIAQLNQYTNLLPDKLRTQFRLQCLKKYAALSAVKGPLKDSHRSFGEGVAETLVDDLLKIRVETFDGETVVVSGEFVEPVQLQVVCQSLWEALPTETTVITENDLKTFGDVSQALQEFYENSINKVVHTININEGILRGWFKNKLITPSETRGTVYRGKEETAGIPNAAVDMLESLHIIRGEVRGGARWYELTHDRLIEPILKSNREWLSKEETEQTRQWLEEKTAKWLDAGSSSYGLLNEIEVIDAERWINRMSVSDQGYSEASRALIAASKAELEQQRQRVEAKLREARRLRRLVVALIGVIFLVVGIAYIAVLQRKSALQNAMRAEISEEQAISARDSANIARAQAVINFQKAKEAEADAISAYHSAESARRRADYNFRMAKIAEDRALEAQKRAINEANKAREEEAKALAAKQEIDRLYRLGTINLDLANEAQLKQQRGEYELAALLGRQAYLFDQGTGTVKKYPNEVFNALRKILNIDTRNTFSKHTDWIRKVVFQPNGKYFASGSNDGTVLKWYFQKGKVIKTDTLAKDTENIVALAFSPDGNQLAYGRSDGKIRIIKNLDKSKIFDIGDLRAGVFDIAFNFDGTKLASGGADGSVLLWDLKLSNSTLLFKNKSRMKTLIFSPDDRMLFVGSEDGVIYQFLFNNQTQKYDLLQKKPAHQNSVNSLAVSITGDTLASCDSDAMVKLWRVKYPEKLFELIRILYGHEGPVNSVAFSPKSKLLASGSADRTVRLWDLQNLNNNPIVLREHDRWVLSVAFNSSGDTLVAGTGNRTIYIWPTRAELLADIICENATRNLTWQEWKEFAGENIEYELTCIHLPPAPDLPEPIRAKLNKDKKYQNKMNK